MAEVGEERVAALEARVADLERALREVTSSRLDTRPQAEQPPGAGAPSPRPRSPALPRPVRPMPPLPPRERSRRAVRWEDLLGARALAWAGGSVLLLGIAFFLAIAVDRGWIGEEARVVLGAMLSAGLLSGAALLRERRGKTEASLVSAGVGIAGFHLTLLAAGALYELIPEWMCIVLSAAVGLASISLALQWESEALALTGLGGAIGATPVLLGGVEPAGLVAIGIVMAAAAFVASRSGWWLVATACMAESGPQVLAWVGDGRSGTIGALAALAGFAGLYLLAGIALWLREPARPLGLGPLLLVTGSVSVLLPGMLIAIEGETRGLPWEGIAVAVTGLLYLGLAMALHGLAEGSRSASGRDLRTLIWGLGLILVAVSLCISFDHLALVAALGAAAVAAAGVAISTAEERLKLGALGFLGLQLVYLLFGEAPPSLLFDSSASPGSEVVGVVLGALTAAVLSGARTDSLRWRAGLLAGGLAIYAGSLEIVTLLSDPQAPLELLGTASTSFQRAHTVVSIFWGVIGFAAMLTGLRRGLAWLRLAGLGLLGLALAKAFLFDLSYLTTFARAISFLGLGALLLGAAYFQQRLGGPPTGSSGRSSNASAG